jgi:hypothetical protein
MHPGDVAFRSPQLDERAHSDDDRAQGKETQVADRLIPRFYQSHTKHPHRFARFSDYHNLRSVALNGMMRSTIPFGLRMRISPERKLARIHGCFSAQSF